VDRDGGESMGLAKTGDWHGRGLLSAIRYFASRSRYWRGVVQAVKRNRRSQRTDE